MDGRGFNRILCLSCTCIPTCVSFFRVFYHVRTGCCDGCRPVINGLVILEEGVIDLASNGRVLVKEGLIVQVRKSDV